MTEDQLRFHLEEYKALRSEIATYVKYTFDFFLYAAGGSRLIAAWVLTHRGELGTVAPGATRVAVFIPFFLSLLAYAAVRLQRFIITRTANYCATIEKAAAMPGLGWETYLSSSDHGAVPFAITLTETGSWVLLILANLAIAIFA